MRSYSGHLMQRFRDDEGNGKILCRDVVSGNWRDPGQVKRFPESNERLECHFLTGKTTKIVGELMGE
ncbi:MAG: hypothetical protein ACYC5X_10150 [Syntrophales bacterium]